MLYCNVGFTNLYSVHLALRRNHSVAKEEYKARGSEQELIQRGDIQTPLVLFLFPTSVLHHQEISAHVFSHIGSSRFKNWK